MTRPDTPAPTPVCDTCGDTHRMHMEDRGDFPCTHCPTPCQACRVGGIGAYCATTPCGCGCHARSKPTPAPQLDLDGLERLIAEASASICGCCAWPAVYARDCSALLAELRQARAAQGAAERELAAARDGAAYATSTLREERDAARKHLARAFAERDEALTCYRALDAAYQSAGKDDADRADAAAARCAAVVAEREALREAAAAHLSALSEVAYTSDQQNLWRNHDEAKHAQFCHDRLAAERALVSARVRLDIALAAARGGDEGKVTT